MEYRTLGGSGLKIPALIFGTATFGGGNEFLRKWGATDVQEATALVDVALEAGCTMFDTADSYSTGLSEEILGAAIKGRRDQALIATKTGMPMGDGPNDSGTSREKIIRSCEASLKRLGTDYVDLYQLHAFDDAGGGDAPCPRHSHPRGQDPLCGGLQLLGLAPDEDAGHG